MTENFLTNFNMSIKRKGGIEETTGKGEIKDLKVVENLNVKLIINRRILDSLLQSPKCSCAR